MVMTVLAGLCVGCGRERTVPAAGEGLVPRSADVKAIAEEQPPFPVRDEPPHISAPMAAYLGPGGPWQVVDYAIADLDSDPEAEFVIAYRPDWDGAPETCVEAIVGLD